jgi:hypothetical protein
MIDALLSSKPIYNEDNNNLLNANSTKSEIFFYNPISFAIIPAHSENTLTQKWTKK